MDEPPPTQTAPPPRRPLCYVLYNDFNTATYNGYTVDLPHRLRQHNGALAGGARYTARVRARDPRVVWKVLCTVTSDDPAFDARTAMSLEWWIKYPTGQRPRPRAFDGAAGRLRGVALAVAKDKFQSLGLRVSQAECDVHRGSDCGDVHGNRP